MAIGKRIEQRLNKLGWRPKDLLDEAAKLSKDPISPQSISNLIRRDSARSEQDEIIAAALGVSVLWLVYGYETEYKPSINNVTAIAAEPNIQVHGKLAELVEIAKTIDEHGQMELIGMAKLLAIQRPSAKQSLVG